MGKGEVGDGELKAVIMAAGPTSEGYGFPPDSKPKCLFHFQGEVLLEGQVRVLREAGINNIVIVAGYKIEMVQEFNKDRQLGLNVLYNPSAASDKLVSRGWNKGIETAKVGVKTADDDVLLIFGDVLLVVESIQKIVEDENQCSSIYSGHGYQLYKVPKALIPALINHPGRGGGMIDLHDFCMKNGGIRMVVGSRPGKDAWMKKCETKWLNAPVLQDVDYFYQTDEGVVHGMSPGKYTAWLKEQEAKGIRYSGWVPVKK